MYCRAMEDVRLKSVVPSEVLREAYYQSNRNSRLSNAGLENRYLPSHLRQQSDNNNRADHNSNIVGLDWGTQAALARDREARIERAFEKNRTIKPKGYTADSSLSDDQDVANAIKRGQERDRFREKIDHDYDFSNQVYHTVSKGAGSLLLSPAATQHHDPKPTFPPLSPIQAIQTSSQTSTVQLFPFSLIQFHREHHNDKTSAGSSRRTIQSHLRICGGVQSCHDAKELAHLIIKNAHLTMFDDDYDKEDEVRLVYIIIAGPFQM
jgi:hypothetical protein